jgi:uncharacterized BrkB/YihY/UPF0761 family membrane protein
MEIPSFITALANAPRYPTVTQPFCWSKAMNTLWDGFKNFFKVREGASEEEKQIFRFILTVKIVVIVAGLLLVVILLMSLILFIMVQNEVRSRNNKDADDFKRDSKRPYKDTLEYKVMNGSIFAKYPYKLLFYITIVGVSIMILGMLISIELENRKKPTAPAGEDPWYSKWNTRFLVVFILLFFVFLYLIEIQYYNKIAEYNAKIQDLNATIRALLPSNMGFLKNISTAPSQGESVEFKLKPALLSLNPNLTEFVRGICAMNLYYYYYEHYKTSQSDLETIMGCFNPIQKLIPSNTTCFTDYLINNNSYIPNKIDIFLPYLNDSEFAESPLKTFVTNNRSKIMLEIGKTMNTINKQSSCLGSSYAFKLFLKMSLWVFVAVWIPSLILIVFLLFRRNSSSVGSTGNSSC